MPPLQVKKKSVWIFDVKKINTNAWHAKHWFSHQDYYESFNLSRLLCFPSP